MKRLLQPVLLGVLVTALSVQAFAAEPFYQRLLQDGLRAHAEGDARRAVQDLTLACFGMLEEPPQLMACRIHLANAQAASGDKTSFTETAGRVLDLEASFNLYEDLNLPSDTRPTFEAHLLEWVPMTSLMAAPALAHLAQGQVDLDLLAMDLSERRTALVDLLANDANNTTWQIRMSEVELLSGEYEEALTRAKAVLEQDSELLGAICVRGQANAALGVCEEALTDLEICDESGSRSDVVARRLDCRIAMQDWEAARDLYDALPSSEKRTNRGRTWRNDIRRGEKEAARTPSPQELSESTEDGSPLEGR